MAALLVAALCVPEAFGDLGLLFAGAYAVVRIAHIVLFALASRGDPGLRRSVIGLAVGMASASGCWSPPPSPTALLQGALWAAALLLDAAGPYFFGSEGWKLCRSTSPSATG